MELSTVLNKNGLHDGPIDYSWSNRIVFADQSAPEREHVHDVSESFDGGVVRWKDGCTYYFSTQCPGIKVTAPENW
jgi:hypothetical protein